MSISEARRVAECELHYRRYTILLQKRKDALFAVVNEHRCRCGADATLGVVICENTLNVQPVIEYCVCEGNCGVGIVQQIDIANVDTLVEEYLLR